jgi:hypothetical protein
VLIYNANLMLKSKSIKNKYLLYAGLYLGFVVIISGMYSIIMDIIIWLR